GRHQGHRNCYGSGPEATDSLGVVRDSPSLPVSGYPSSAEWDGPNVDTKWTVVESRTRDAHETVRRGCGAPSEHRTHQRRDSTATIARAPVAPRVSSGPPVVLDVLDVHGDEEGA